MARSTSVPLAGVLVSGVSTVLLVFSVGASQATAAPTHDRGNRSSELPTSCDLTELPVPDGASGSAVNAGDRSGRYLVGNDYVDGIYPRYALLWDRTKPRVLDPPGEYPEATAVNGSGEVVGFSTTDASDGGYLPWVYRDGTVEALPGVDEGLPRDINERGDVVGDRTARGTWTPVLWPAGADDPIDLPVPSDVESGVYAVGVAENGTVVGVHHDASVRRPDRLFAWRPGDTAEPVELPAPGDGLNAYGMVAVRGTKVAAKAYDDRRSGISRSVEWDLTALAEPVAVSEVVVQPHAVNERGWIAGEGATDAAAGQREAPAIASIEQGAFRLPGVGSGAATAISSDGRTIGGNARGAAVGQVDAVRWVCR